MRSLDCFLALILAASAHIHSHHRYGGLAPGGDIYALIVAGSYKWENYRHQADACHAYHTLKNHGVPEENIITMMYDDIAYNEMNPYPGKIFNSPNGEDVYGGVKIDYKGEAVNPQNFLNILKGNAGGVVGGNGRVIESKPNDRIFVFFTDHGGDGIICFPHEVLTVKELNDALNWMHENHRYNQLVFYLEACESGSMFEKTLKSNINVYAVTAANSEEPSSAAFCLTDLRTCLGDVFSVNWMIDSDQEDITVETLDDQYKIVTKQTDTSHVMHYGNLSMGIEPVGWFQGEDKIHRGSYIKKEERIDSWPSRDVELLYLQKMLFQKTKDDTNKISEAKELSRKIEKILDDRQHIQKLIHNLLDNILDDAGARQRMLEKHNAIEKVDCHSKVVHVFDSICIDLNKYDYALKYMYVLNNLCTEIGDSKAIIDSMRTICPKTRSRFF